MSNPIFEQQPGLVESSFVAKVYSKTNQTSSEIIDALFDEMDSSYGDIDTFIRDAGDDIEALFDELDQQFCEFLNERHIYQYDEDDLSAYTRNSSPARQQVMAAVINMRDEIDGKEADERAYRSARKDGRGRVVGGGFGFSGAVKGMAAAGAINMTKTVAPDKQIQDMFQLCGCEEDFLGLRSKILAMDITDHEKANLLEALDVAMRQRLSEALEKAQAYEEAKSSPKSTITGAISLVVIGALCNYFFSVRWPFIVSLALAVLGVISTFAERSNTSKSKENEQAAALIGAYRQRGYKL